MMEYGQVCKNRRISGKWRGEEGICKRGTEGREDISVRKGRYREREGGRSRLKGQRREWKQKHIIKKVGRQKETNRKKS